MELTSEEAKFEVQLSGMNYLILAKEQEDKCEEISCHQWANLGKKAPRCFDGIGNVLFLLEYYACCHWGCKGGDHVPQRLIGRVVSSSRASLRLLQLGFYDESLAISRNIDEIANLILLFCMDKASFTHWLSLPDRDRSELYKPSAVRELLRPLGKVLQIDGKRYGMLCKVGTHVSPETVPQEHNSSGIPTLGGHYQGQGALVTLNELAIPLMYIAMCLAKIADIAPLQKEALTDAGKILASNIGGVNITSNFTQNRR